jgi:hypothetical protein
LQDIRPGGAENDWAQEAGMNIFGLFSDGPDGGLGFLMSALAGAATALAIAIVLTVYFHTGYRTTRDLIKHSLAAIFALGLLAFVASDMRNVALAYLGINPTKPAIEFEIRMPKADLSALSDTQIELHTDRNQSLASLENAANSDDGRSVLRGVVALDYRTTDRVVVLNLPGRAQCEFKLRLAANPSRSDEFSPWHLADRVASPIGGDLTDPTAHDAFSIRYRVI